MLLLALGAEAAHGAGTTALVSREFDLWPTGTALGGAAAAHPDPLLALWANPAQLAGAPGQVGATHTEWFQDTRLEQLGAVLGGGGRLVLGVSTQLVTTGDIPLRPLSAGVAVPYAAPLDQFDAKDFGVGLSAGYRVRSDLSAGVALRWLSQKVYVYEASSLALDLGASWQTAPTLRLSACVNNVGASLKWDHGVEAPLPLSVRAGLAWAPRTQVALYGDVWASRERSLRGATGVEWRPSPLLALRAGYVAGQDEQSFSAGTGLFWRGLGFEYALVPRSANLGTIHRFALHFTPSRHKKSGQPTAGS
jgi:hypothetical protein